MSSSEFENENVFLTIEDGILTVMQKATIDGIDGYRQLAIVGITDDFKFRDIFDYEKQKQKEKFIENNQTDIFDFIK